MEYVRKVQHYLESIDRGTVVDLSKSPTREDFIQVAKWYIDTWPNQIEFSSDYNKIRKK